MCRTQTCSARTPGAALLCDPAADALGTGEARAREDDVDG